MSYPTQNTDPIGDLQELYDLADQVCGNREAAGGIPSSGFMIVDGRVKLEPTIYSTMGKKPEWPYWSKDTFAQFCVSESIDWPTL